MSATSRSSALVLATAVAGLTGVIPANADDDWETPVVSATSGVPVEEDDDCDVKEEPAIEEPRDELQVIDDLVTDLRCVTAKIIWPRLCYTNPTNPG